MLSTYISSLNSMQIKVSSAVAFDFNQLIKAVCAPPGPADLDLCSAPPHRLIALPLPPRPLKKTFPAHPCFAICMVFRRQIKLSAYSATSPGWNEPPPILQQLVTYKFSHQIRWAPLGFKIFFWFCFV